MGPRPEAWVRRSRKAGRGNMHLGTFRARYGVGIWQEEATAAGR